MPPLTDRQHDIRAVTQELARVLDRICAASIALKGTDEERAKAIPEAAVLRREVAAINARLTAVLAAPDDDDDDDDAPDI